MMMAETSGKSIAAKIRKRQNSSSMDAFIGTLHDISVRHGDKLIPSKGKNAKNFEGLSRRGIFERSITAFLACTIVVASLNFETVLLLSALGLALGTLFLPFQSPLHTRVSFVCGFLLFTNWFLFWMIPIVVQGAVFKLVLLNPAQKVFNFFDKSEILRRFAASYIYKKPKYADFFATQLLFLVNATASLSFVVYYWNISEDGVLPWWLIAVYNFAWIGLGGRSMGAAYSIAHKEGHFDIYRPYIKRSLGNVFENLYGVFYGSVPYNFTTTHISIHHRLNGGRGDTLYNWDISRCSVPSFMLYLTRGLLHTSGIGGLRQFYLSPRKRDTSFCFRKLATGCFVFWIACPLLCVAIFDLSFYYWIVLQPLLCMTFFLSIINHAFHGFIEKDAKTGEMIDCVASTTMVGSLDDYFGEDDHMAHHHYVSVYYKDLPEHQRSQRDLWKQKRASVFQGLDVFTFSICILFKAWPVLASRYLDFSGKMTATEIERMLETRAKRRETCYGGTLPDIPWTSNLLHVYTDAPEGVSPLSRFYPKFDEYSKRFQLWVCREMNKGLPPVKKISDF